MTYLGPGLEEVDAALAARSHKDRLADRLRKGPLTQRSAFQRLPYTTVRTPPTGP